MFSTTGGIQTFSQHFLEALRQQLGSERIRLALKNDGSEAVLNHNGFRSVVGYGDWPRALRSARFASECLRHACNERPRLIVSTHVNFGPIAQIATRATAVPYVLVAHGIDAWWLDSRSRHNALKKADLVLAVSRFTRDWLIKMLNLEARKVEILPNTFQPARYAPDTKSPRLMHKYGLSSQTPVILTVCRLAGAERYKGYDQMITALPKILREVPGARYMVVGTGPDRDRIEKLSVDLGVKNAVTFAGFVPDQELCDYYNLCDLFAMPSKAEGFGIVFLEALACGKPVLAGNKDGSRDALADGELGLLVDPDNIEEIASETIRVLKREHSHPKIFQPEMLRLRVTELFGFQAFKNKVAEQLKPFLDGQIRRQ